MTAMQPTSLGWARSIPSHWKIVPLGFVAKMGTGHTPDRSRKEYWENCTVPWVTTPDVTRRGGSLTPLMDTEQKISELGMANSAAVMHPAGTVMLSRTASIGYSIRIGRPMTTTQAFVTWYPGPDLDSRYLLLVLRAMEQEWERLAYGSTHLTIYMPDLESIRIPLPPLEEQRRIADFLDAETARINRIAQARAAQYKLLDSRFIQFADGAVWRNDGKYTPGQTGKISRLCEVIPGYSFPSDKFTQLSKARLLRGANVSIGKISWEDCVWWDTDAYPISAKFHLRVGDLVIGMDRPWISSGMRISFISEEDTPCLLLQRVACLRPKSSTISMEYLYWVLRSTHFRGSIESELTGVSVPHLSGDQIGSFTFPLPPEHVQRQIAERLREENLRTVGLQSAMTRQATLLAERRQALITAAVTGQFDVSSASGRGLTDGAPA